MSRLLTFLVLLAVTALGAVRLWARRRQLIARNRFLREFRDRLQAYLDSRGEDGRAYAELTTKLERMQREAGSAPIIGIYRPPYENVQYRNYPVIENIVPSLQQRVITLGWTGSQIGFDSM